MARKLEVEIVGDASSLHRALNQSTQSTSKYGSVLGKLKTAAIGAGVAVAGGVVVGLEKSIHAAMEAEAVNARLGVAFKNAGLNANKYKDQIEKLESGSRRLGFTDDDVKNSLGSLITATGDYAKAAKDVSVAQDIARFKGVSLTDATKMLTMAMTGSQRAAKQLGITVSPVTTAYDKLKASGMDLTTAEGKAAAAHAKLMDKFATGQAVIDAVTAKVHGQADAYSKTASGAMEQFKAQLNHIEIEIGEKLLPVMVSAVQWVSAHWPEITKTIQQSWRQIEPTLKALMALVVQVVATIRAHWSTIGPIVRAAGQIIEGMLRELAGMIRLITALLRGDWSGAWIAMKQIASGAAQAMKGAVRYELLLVKAAIDVVIAGIKSLIGWFNHKFAVPAINAVIGVFRDLYNAVMAVVGAVEKLISLLNHIPHPHLPHIGLPHLASGGTVTRSGMALVGERGPEVLALPGGASVIPLGSGGGGGGGMAMPSVIQLVLPDGRVLAEAAFDGTRSLAQRYMLQTGRSAFA